MPNEVVRLRQGVQLEHYDTGCRAIAEAWRIDEVKVIADKALAMEVYARQSKNLQLEADSWALLKRARRRVGQLMAEMIETRQLREGRPPENETGSINPVSNSLERLNISKNVAKEARRLRVIPEREFSEKVEQGREAIANNMGQVEADHILTPPAPRVAVSPLRDINVFAARQIVAWTKFSAGDSLKKLKELARFSGDVEPAKARELARRLRIVIRIIDGVATKLERESEQ